VCVIAIGVQEIPENANEPNHGDSTQIPVQETELRVTTPQVSVPERVDISPPVTPTYDGKYDDLIKLSELKDKGILTQDEFDAKKRQILGL